MRFSRIRLSIDWLAENQIQSSIVNIKSFQKPSSKRITFPEFRQELGSYPYILQEDGTITTGNGLDRRLIILPKAMTSLRQKSKWGEDFIKSLIIPNSIDVDDVKAAVVICSHERAVLGLCSLLEPDRIYDHHTFKTYAVRREGGEGLPQNIADYKKGKRQSQGAQLRRRLSTAFVEKIEKQLKIEPYREILQNKKGQDCDRLLHALTQNVLYMRGESHIFGQLDLKRITQIKAEGDFLKPTVQKDGTNKKSSAEEELRRMSKYLFTSELVIEQKEKS